MGARSKGGSGTTRGRERTELARAALAAIQPVLRVLLELGITSPEAESLLRSLFVHEASAWVAEHAGGIAPSDSQVAFATGVHRNLVRHILAEPPQIARQRVSRGHRAGRVLEAWHTDRAYKDVHGNPMDLPEKGAAPSLAALVSRYLPGGSCGVVLRELMRSGAVQSLPDRRLRVRTRRALLPGGMTLEGLRAYGEQGRSFLETLTSRLLNPELGPFCDSTAAFGIDARHLAAVRELIRLRASTFLGGLDAELARDAARGRRRGGTAQVAVSVIETGRHSRSGRGRG